LLDTNPTRILNLNAKSTKLKEQQLKNHQRRETDGPPTSMFAQNNISHHKHYHAKPQHDAETVPIS
jgi:hypothetical protein